MQVAVPTREDVEEYRNLIAYTNALVGHINGKYGSIDYMPLQFINNSVPFQELAALYAIADVCLVTSIRDGMNLVSYEFVAAQPHSNPGVLILSEFAGRNATFGVFFRCGSILQWRANNQSMGYHRTGKDNCHGT